MRSVFAVAMGLAFLIGGASQAKAALIVTNGSFETGDFTPGWQKTGDDAVEPSGSSSFTAPDGSWFAELAVSGTSASISQTVSDTAGEFYTLSLYFGDAGGSGSDHLDIIWNNQSVPVRTIALSDTGGHFSKVSVTVQGTGTDLIMLSTSTSGLTMLDDVSLDPVTDPSPEPGSLVLLGIAGLNLAGYFGLRRRRQSSAVA